MAARARGGPDRRISKNLENLRKFSNLEKDITRCLSPRRRREASQREAVSPPRALAGSEPGAMDTAMDMYYTLRDMRKRQLAHQVLNLAMIVCSALMIWKSLMVITESDSPVVVVLRCSHRPLPARTPDLGAATHTLSTLTRAAAGSQWEHGAGVLPRRHPILAHGLHTLPCRRHRGLQGGRS